jgi:hypothetical protein
VLRQLRPGCLTVLPTALEPFKRENRLNGPQTDGAAKATRSQSNEEPKQQAAKASSVRQVMGK